MNTITMPGVSASQPPGQGASPSPGHATLALPPPPAAPTAAPPTPFLQVEGMVTAEVLTDDEEYAEVGPSVDLDPIPINPVNLSPKDRLMMDQITQGPTPLQPLPFPILCLLQHLCNSLRQPISKAV